MTSTQFKVFISEQFHRPFTIDGTLGGIQQLAVASINGAGSDLNIDMCIRLMQTTTNLNNIYCSASKIIFWLVKWYVYEKDLIKQYHTNGQKDTLIQNQDFEKIHTHSQTHRLRPTNLARILDNKDKNGAGERGGKIRVGTYENQSGKDKCMKSLLTITHTVCMSVLCYLFTLVQSEFEIRSLTPTVLHLTLS